MIKLCKGCGRSLPITAFSKHPQMLDGYLNFCKTCVRDRAKNFPSRSSAGRAAYNRYNRQLRGLPVRAPCLPEIERRARHRISSRNWARRKRGTPLNAPLRNDSGRAPEYYRAHYTVLEAKRGAAKKQRTPPWLNQAYFAEIEGMYHFAKFMGQITGRKYHVDHIEPVQGSDVSGLHVPWNMQVIPAIENIRKGNRRNCTHG